METDDNDENGTDTDNAPLTWFGRHGEPLV